MGLATWTSLPDDGWSFPRDRSVVARHLPSRRDALDACARRIVSRDSEVRYLQLEDARLARALVEVLSWLA